MVKETKTKVLVNSKAILEEIIKRILQIEGEDLRWTHGNGRKSKNREKNR